MGGDQRVLGTHGCHIDLLISEWAGVWVGGYRSNGLFLCMSQC